MGIPELSVFQNYVSETISWNAVIFYYLIQDATAWDYKRDAEKTAVSWYLICRLS